MSRMEEAKATGAKLMITACPNCQVNLKQAGRSMKVIDITSLMAQGAYGHKGKVG